MDLRACLDEMQKLGAISDEQARRAADRLDALHQNAPSAKQMGRNVAIGAAAGPVVGAVGNVIMGNLKDAKSPRVALANAAKGALATGSVPLLQRSLDRKSEEKTLKTYLKEKST